MRKRLRSRMLLAITMCIAVISIGGCAVGPSIDGGIVGTGNRMDCEPQTTKEGTQVPLPEECKPQSGRSARRFAALSRCERSTPYAAGAAWICTQHDVGPNVRFQ